MGRAVRAAAGRLAVSESLARSALVKRAGGVMPLRETAIIVALVNHPALAEENFDAVEGLDLSHPDLRQLHAALIDALAHGQADDRAGDRRRRSQSAGLREPGSGRWR